MKTLLRPITTVSADGKKVTIVADIEDLPFNEQIITRVTHGHFNPENDKHPRHIQSSSAAVFVRHGGWSFVVPNDSLAAIAAAVEPMTTFAPVIKHGSTPENLEIVSELPATFQWQVSDDAFPVADKPHTPPPPAVWTDLPGQTAASVDETLLKDGQYIRCIITNATGETTSKPAQYKK